MTLDSLIENLGGDLVKFGQIAVHHDSQAANQEYAAIETLSGDQLSAHISLTHYCAKKFLMESSGENGRTEGTESRKE